jgi:anthranilate phosphoribosyltransferase
LEEYMSVVVTDSEAPEVEADEPSEIVEATGEAITEAIEASEDSGMPPASQGELAMSNAMLAAVTRLEAVAGRLEDAVQTMGMTTVVAAEIAAEMADATDVLEEAAASEAEEETNFLETIDEENGDVPPSNRRNRFRNAWGSPGRK